MTRVYVASAFQEFARARAAMEYLWRYDLVVTLDWTIGAEGNPSDAATSDVRRVHAEQDLDGVATADVVLVLTPGISTLGCGMWSELGAALALRKPLVISGAQRARSVFCELGHQFEHDAEALEFIVEQPTMRCPRCRRVYFDFDGVGVPYCDPKQRGCGFCQHFARSRGLALGVAVVDGWRCDYCGEVKLASGFGPGGT